MSLFSALFLGTLSWTSHPDDYGPIGHSIPIISSAVEGEHVMKMWASRTIEKQLWLLNQEAQGEQR